MGLFDRLRPDVPSGGVDEPLDTNEECNEEGCTNTAIHLGLCKQCNEDHTERIIARQSVEFGDAAAAYERRCFDCEETEHFTTAATTAAPDDEECANCHSENVEINEIIHQNNV